MCSPNRAAHGTPKGVQTISDLVNYKHRTPDGVSLPRMLTVSTRKQALAGVGFSGSFAFARLDSTINQWRDSRELFEGDSQCQSTF